MTEAVGPSLRLLGPVDEQPADGLVGGAQQVPNVLERAASGRSAATVPEARPGPALADTLQLVADTIVESLGFGVAVVNVVDQQDESMVVVAVAGPESTRSLLLGQRQLQDNWRQLLAASEPWGRLFFLDHRSTAPQADQVLMWVPDLPRAAGPDDWDPEDALFAPLTAAGGELVGILSVDCPVDGLRPGPTIRRALEAFSVTASLAIQHANLHAATLRSEEHFRELFASSPIAIAVVDAQRVFVQVNDAYCTLLGRPRQDLLGRTPLDFTDPVDRLVDPSRVVGPAERRPAVDQRYLRPDGSQVWGRVHLTALAGSPEQPGLTLVQVEDITASKRAEQRLLQEALVDPLTGLANRACLLQRLTAAVRRDTAGPGLTVVLFCDLDRLKLVNDGHGHGVGDEYIRAVGQRLRACVRGSDTVGRLSGDEFVVVLEDVSTPTEAIGMAGQVIEAVHRPVRLSGATFTPSLSVGIAYTSDSSTEPSELLARADAAMYAAKAAGRGGWQVYDSAVRNTALSQLELRNDVPAALELGQFVLHHQPVLRTSDEAVVGHEALLRWQHPRLGLLAPGQFLDVVLDSEYETPVTDWVLHSSCRSAAQRPAGRRQVSVNVSSQQVSRPDLPDVVAEALRRAGLHPSQLVLELTEDRLLSQPHGAQDLQRLRDLGLKIAIDDFGTGYAGLGYLQRLPVDIVKIDRSFTVQAPADPVSGHIVRGVVELAHRCGMHVVAEGVETREQAVFLKELGAGYLQGFLFGRPQP